MPRSRGCRVHAGGHCQRHPAQRGHLQLDIRNYFMSIDKPRLFAMVGRQVEPAPAGRRRGLWLARYTRVPRLHPHRCIRGDPTLVDRLPTHKTLFHAPPGKGLPIGNLNSQFFANVYLNALDQFVKHELKCRWYLRYCDDLCWWRVRLRRDCGSARHASKVSGTSDLTCCNSTGRASGCGRWRRRGLLGLHRSARPTCWCADGWWAICGRLWRAAARSLVDAHSGRPPRIIFYPQPLDTLQAQLGVPYLGHLRRARADRLVAAICGPTRGCRRFVDAGPAGRCACAVATTHRGRTHGAGAVPALAQKVCRRRGADSGGCVRRAAAWPPRRLVSRGRSGKKQGTTGLRRMRPTSRGAIKGFPLSQLRRRVALLATGRNVTVLSQHDTAGGGIMQRLPLARWVSSYGSQPKQ